MNARRQTGLLRRTEPAEPRTARDHHLVCRGCGRTEDAGHLGAGIPCAETTTPAGFTIDEAEVVFWGYCPDCPPIT